MFSGKSKIYLLLHNVEGLEFSNPKMETLKEPGGGALLAFVLRIVALAPAHLLAVQGMHRRVGIDGEGLQMHVGRRPHTLPQQALQVSTAACPP